jgi:hypothetical protein
VWEGQAAGAQEGEERVFPGGGPAEEAEVPPGPLQSLVADCLYGVHMRCAIRGQVAGGEESREESVHEVSSSLHRFTSASTISPFIAQCNKTALSSRATPTPSGARGRSRL